MALLNIEVYLRKESTTQFSANRGLGRLSPAGGGGDVCDLHPAREEEKGVKCEYQGTHDRV